MLSSRLPKKLDSISAQMLLREAYEQAYEIWEAQANPDHPWNLVLSRAKEDYHTYDQVPTVIEKFHLNKVYTHFGISLTEFLNLPKEIVNDLFATCERIEIENRKIIANAQTEMQNAQKQTQ